MLDRFKVLVHLVRNAIVVRLAPNIAVITLPHTIPEKDSRRLEPSACNANPVRQLNAQRHREADRVAVVAPTPIPLGICLRLHRHAKVLGVAVGDPHTAAALDAKTRVAVEIVARPPGTNGCLN